MGDYSDYEALFESCKAHLDVDRRVSILNQRFEVLLDLFDFLEEELNHRQETRITWVIIVLCALEAFVMGLRLYARCMHGGWFAGSSPHLTAKPDGSTGLDLTATTPILSTLWWVARLFHR